MVANGHRGPFARAIGSSNSPAKARAPDLRSDRRPVRAPIHSPHPSRLNDREVASGRPSMGRRMLRSLTRFSIAVLIGVGVTRWQSYGDAAKETVIARAPTLAWLLSTSTTKPPVVATTSPGLVRQLERLAFNLDVCGAE
jgi:hypothetical protein